MDWPTLEGMVGGGGATSHGRREQAEPTGWFGLGGWRKKKTRHRRYTTDVRIQICHGHAAFPMKIYSPFDVLVRNKFVGAGAG